MSFRKHTLLALLVIATVTLSACGPRAGRVDATTLSPDAVVIDLPAIYIDFDANGTPTIGGQTLDQVGAQLGQQLPAVPSLPAAQIQMLTDYNIQHIQINNSPKGLQLLVNGMQIPSLGWSPEQLSATVDTLNSFGIPLPPDVAGILPMLGNVGVGIVLRFPLKEGATAIPTEVEGGMSAPAESIAAQKQYLDSIGQAPVIKFAVFYNADGSWTVDGKGPNDYAKSFPDFKWEGLNMNPSMIKRLTSVGVKNFTLSTNPSGIFIAINGKQLPNLTWGNGEIEHTLALAEQTGLLQMAAGNVANLSDIINQVKSLLPAVQTTDFSITVNLPQ
ncbi:MAG: hypothetical protein U0175_10455 [Caldilineaceae bacterium]